MDFNKTSCSTLLRVAPLSYLQSHILVSKHVFYYCLTWVLIWIGCKEIEQLQTSSYFINESSLSAVSKKTASKKTASKKIKNKQNCGGKKAKKVKKSKKSKIFVENIWIFFWIFFGNGHNQPYQFWELSWPWLELLDARGISNRLLSRQFF